MASWRSMLPEDIPAVWHLSSEIHSSLPESPSIFSERLSLFPAGCLVIKDPDSNSLQGYLISHPILSSQPPALDAEIGAIHFKADTYYIHDLVLSKESRGRGLAEEGIKHVLEVAARGGYASACLISVYGTGRFWEKHGFRRQAVESSLAEKLQGYGDDAVFMTRSIQL